jgi:hypothetical protein
MEQIGLDIDVEERHALEAEAAHHEAKEKVAHMQSLLEAASRLSPSICSKSKPHKCFANQPALVGQRKIIRNLLWIVEYPTIKKSLSRVVLLRYQMKNHRVVAFHDIQNRTGSKLGNGRSGLRNVTDRDGHITSHGCGNYNVVSLNSWSLLRQRFQAHIEYFKGFCVWVHKLGNVHEQLLGKPHGRKNRIIKKVYTDAILFHQPDSEVRWALGITGWCSVRDQFLVVSL